MEQQTGSKLGKEYIKAVYCHLAYLTSVQSTSCEMLGWMKHKLESRLLGELSITSDRQMTPPLWQKVKRTLLKSLLMKVKEESEKAGLKLNIQKLWSWHLVPSLMTNSWGNNGNSDRLYFFEIQNHCRCWLQLWNEKMLAPWKKAMTNLDSILKSRDITLLTNVSIVKVMVFQLVTYGCESWTIKKAEWQRIDAFELWC